MPGIRVRTTKGAFTMIALAAIPVILISWALAATSVSLMMGAVEWGVIPVAATREVMRQQGFPEGLGPLSADYGAGIIVDPGGDRIGKYLAMLSQNFEEYEWMQGKVFLMKVSEAETVFNHLRAIEANGHWQNMAKMMALPPARRAEFAQTEQWFKDQLKVGIIPLNDLLKAFPEGRTGQVRAKAAA